MSALDACKYLLVAAQMGILHKNETVAGSVHEFMLIVACSLQPVAEIWNTPTSRTASTRRKPLSAEIEVRPRDNGF